MINSYNLEIKLIIIGGSGVGKSSLLTQFAENRFNEDYCSTVGVDLRFKSIKHEGRNIKFQIWDTAGQERFRTVTSTYYKGVDGIVMVYDVTDPSSVDELESYWIGQAYNYCDKNINVLLVGNKCDAEEKVKPERIKKIAEMYRFITAEVSAKTGERVQTTFKEFGVKIAMEKMMKLGQTQQIDLTVDINKKIKRTSNPHLQIKNQIKEVNLINQLTFQHNETQPSIKLKGNRRAPGPSYQKKCC